MFVNNRITNKKKSKFKKKQNNKNFFNHYLIMFDELKLKVLPQQRNSSILINFKEIKKN